MENRNGPIGVFDSGIGGLTVLREITRLLPRENTVYLGDTARVPYGSKSRETIIRYSFEDARFLLGHGIKMLVVACNTASGYALDALKKNLRIPVVGVIEPGARKALEVEKARRVGIIGTEGTIKSNSYVNAIMKLSGREAVEMTEHGKKSYDRYFEVRTDGVVIFTKACPLFVPLAEEGWTDNNVARLTVRYYLKGLKKEKVDSLILGCTHYPILKKTIASVMGKNVTLIDSAAATAEAVRARLTDDGLLNAGRAKGKHKFFVTDSPERFVKAGKRFFGNKLRPPELARLEG